MKMEKKTTGHSKIILGFYKMLSEKRLDGSQWTLWAINYLHNEATNTIVTGRSGWKQWFVGCGCINEPIKLAMACT